MQHVREVQSEPQALVLVRFVMSFHWVQFIYVSVSAVELNFALKEHFPNFVS
jgi:hypothetical protein